MATRPNLARCLFLLIKFYWDIATSVCLCVVCGCFHATMVGLRSCAETIWPTKPVQKNFANSDL